jgi:hypothetical protein
MAREGVVLDEGADPPIVIIILPTPEVPLPRQVEQHIVGQDLF